MFKSKYNPLVTINTPDLTNTISMEKKIFGDKPKTFDEGILDY